MLNTQEKSADTDHEDEEEYHDTTCAVAMSWEEAHLREVQVPLVSKDASSPSGRVNVYLFVNNRAGS